jgi:hypothetical protein
VDSHLPITTQLYIRHILANHEKHDIHSRHKTRDTNTDSHAPFIPPNGRNNRKCLKKARLREGGGTGFTLYIGSWESPSPRCPGGANESVRDLEAYLRDPPSRCCGVCGWAEFGQVACRLFGPVRRSPRPALRATPPFAQRK